MHVILVRGLPSSEDKDKLRFCDEIREIKDSLAIDFCFSEISGNLTYLFGLKDNVKLYLERAFLDHSDEDILLIYLGHGWHTGLAIEGNIKNIITHEELGLIFAHHNGKLIFINDSCFALSLEEAMQYHAQEHLLIGSATKDYPTIGGIIKNTFHAWQNGLIYKPTTFIPHDANEEFVIRKIYDHILRRPELDSSKEGFFVDLRLGDYLDNLMFNNRRKLLIYQKQGA